MVTFILADAFPPPWVVIAGCASLRCKVAMVTKFSMVLYNIFIMSLFWCHRFNVVPMGYSFPFLI